jgi:uncharacterized protein YutE (UPF0331/DUF86 family)
VGERVSLSGQQLTLDDVASFHRGLRNSIELDRAHQVELPHDDMQSAEIEEDFRSALAELDHLSSLSAMSSVEATLRVNYLRRVYRRYRDPLSRAMRQMHRVKGHRVGLEGDLIRLWSNEGQITGTLLREIIQAFQYRHWLAHGRYWTLKLARDYDFAGLFEIAEEFVTAMQDYDDRCCAAKPSSRRRQRNRLP